VTVIGIYSIKKAAKQGRGKDKGAVGVRMPYLRVVGIQVIHKFFFSFISKLPRS
jgi:hypothetical protein